MPPTTTPKRHLFTQSELESYFNRISFPKDSRIYNVSHLSEPEKLTFLTLLQSYQLVAVPWENVTQHYSWHRVVHISPRHLFRKIVDNPGRGGYCMEVNYFFHHILYSLGFDTYMCGSRIFNTGSGKFGGWTHVVNLVRIGGKKYLCDGGYGAAGPTGPLVLEDGLVQGQVAPAESRLVWEGMEENLNEGMRVWKYQHRFCAPNESPSEDEDEEDQYEDGEDEYSDEEIDYDYDYDHDSRPPSPTLQRHRHHRNKPSQSTSTTWTTHYCFPDFEFTPADISAMNFAPSTNPQTFFTHTLVASRFTFSTEKNSTRGPCHPSSSSNTPTLSHPAPPGEIDGAITLVHDILKWRRKGKKVVEWKLKDEGERVQALEMYYGIVLDEEDREAIRGTAAAIRERGTAD